MLHFMEHIAQVWHMMRDIRMLGATCAHGNIVFGCLHTTLQIAFTPYHGQCAVMQGMGEPLNNYNEVSSAVKMMVDPQVFALRRSAVTVSTVGVIPRMLQMVEDLPGVSLALSLHAPTQELRKTIVPSAKSYPLDKLMAAVDKYQMQTRQKVRNLLLLFASDFCAAQLHDVLVREFM